MKPNQNQGQSQEAKPVDPFEKVDAPLQKSDDNFVAIGRVVRAGQDFPHNVPGERVSLPAQKGAWLAQQGLFRLEISKVRPSELDAAGGVDAWLAKHPQKDKLTKDQRRGLKPIPGKVDVEVARPWDFISVED